VRLDGAAAWGWHGCIRLLFSLYVVVFNVFLCGRLCLTLLFTFPRTPHSPAVFVVARDRLQALSLLCWPLFKDCSHVVVAGIVYLTKTSKCVLTQYAHSIAHVPFIRRH